MIDHSSLSSDTAPTALCELPPSPKLIAKVLDYEGELTQAQLAEKTLLPKRTVRHALTKLEERDLVASRSSVTDARHQIYSLNTKACEKFSQATAPSTIQS